MKILDDRGRLFGLVNVIDLLVLLLVVAAAYTLFTRFVADDMRYDPGAVPVTITTHVSEVRQPTVDAMKVGDTVYDHVTGQVIGEIVQKEVEPYREPVDAGDGRLILAEVPERYNINVVLEGYGHDLGRTIRVASYEVRVGSSLTLQGREFSVASTVFKVEVGR